MREKLIQDALQKLRELAEKKGNRSVASIEHTEYMLANEPLEIEWREQLEQLSADSGLTISEIKAMLRCNS